jgi:fructose-bisphosphate aldolase/2-amino-3,7-dideoxy-D-threo-hept-6-ulosonate synthase
MVSSVKQALAVDADAVAYQIHIGSTYESAMLIEAGQVIRTASNYDLPVLVIAYPRGEHADGSVNDFLDVRDNNPDEYVKLCSHAARIAVEIGADIVKARYPGSPERFAGLVQACEPVSVLIAGGPFRDRDILLRDVRDALKVGGAGVAVGRSVFEAADPGATVRALDELEKAGLSDQLAGGAR